MNVFSAGAYGGDVFPQKPALPPQPSPKESAFQEQPSILTGRGNPGGFYCPPLPASDVFNGIEQQLAARSSSLFIPHADGRNEERSSDSQTPRPSLGLNDFLLSLGSPFLFPEGVSTVPGTPNANGSNAAKRQPAVNAIVEFSETNPPSASAVDGGYGWKDNDPSVPGVGGGLELTPESQKIPDGGPGSESQKIPDGGPESAL